MLFSLSSAGDFFSLFLLRNLGSGVPDAGILLADEMASALNDREELRVVSLDLHGAFDRVWWRDLLAHLWNVGLRGCAYDLFSDYFYFVVAANGVLSS